MREVTVRQMSPGQLEQVIDWASAEGWNPGIGDAEPFYAADPSGFFMAFDGEEPVGSISAVSYGTDFGFIGCFIVKPAYRGHRIGIDLGRKALEYLTGRLIGIDGVEAKVRHYRRFGFIPSHQNIRYEGIAKIQSPSRSGRQPLPCERLPLDKILDYDRAVFGWSRGAFMRLWLGQPLAKSMAVLNSSGNICGYGVIRQCRRGYKIGPLFCDHAADAGKLLSALIGAVIPGAPYYLDLPDLNPRAAALAEKYRLKPIFKTARMYNRAHGASDFTKVFGLTSFELG